MKEILSKGLRLRGVLATMGSAAAVCCFGVIANAATPINPAPATVSASSSGFPYGVNNVVNMWRAGTKTADLVSYVKGTAVPYQLTADELIQLKETGVPPEVIQAIIQRGAQLKQEKEVPPPPAAAILAYGGVGGEDYGDAPLYGYDYPYFEYPYDEWPYYLGPLDGFYGYGYGYHDYRGFGLHDYQLHGGHFGGYGFHGGFHGGFRGGFHGGGGHGGGGGHR